MYSDEGHTEDMMSAGVRKYLLKDGDIKELPAAIREAADSGKSQSLQ